MLDTTIQVKTDSFDGPMGLLLLLIQKEEMDIRSLDLTDITKQYLEYLSKMHELNFDVAGDYLFLAATLVLLKSKDCLSEEDESNLKDQLGENQLGITSQADLVYRLEQLRKFQRMGEMLWKLPKKGHEIFTRPKVDRKVLVNSILIPMDLEKLTTSFVDFIVKEKRKYTVIKRDRLSIKEKLVYLTKMLKVGDTTTLNQLLAKDEPQKIDDLVITFISLLELTRLNKVDIFQNEDRGDVYVKVQESLDDFDVNSANGFGEEDEDEDSEIEDSIEAGIQDIESKLTNKVQAEAMDTAVHKAPQELQ
jgi:segregation and condensation protein A